MTDVLTPGSVSLSDLAAVFWNGRVVRLDTAALSAVERAAARIAQVAAGDEAVYGVNTGFG